MLRARASTIRRRAGFMAVALVGASALYLHFRRVDEPAPAREHGALSVQPKRAAAAQPELVSQRTPAVPVRTAQAVEKPPEAVLVNAGKTEDALPLVVAPSPEASTERDEELLALRTSGPGGDQWREHFEAVRREWLRTLDREHIEAELFPWECHANGCAVTARFQVVEDLERFSDLALNGIATKEWKGAGFRSGPIETKSSKIEATWIFTAGPNPSR